jgi:DNA-binding MarR family transcriptional regulator
MRPKKKLSEKELKKRAKLVAETMESQENWIAKKKEREAECRRRLLAELNPEAAEFTRREFARMGLMQ